MKKNILSIVTAGLVISGVCATGAMASNTTALTKATVKLIKDNRAMTQQVMSIQSEQATTNAKIEQNKVLIKNVMDDNKLINDRLNENAQQSSMNKDFINQNAGEVSKLNAFKTSTEEKLKTFDLRIIELGKKVGVSQENLQKINANSSKNSNVSLTTKQEVEQLKEAFAKFKEESSKDLTKLSSQNTSDGSGIKELQKENSILKGELKNIKELLENYKIFTDAEIKVLKTKLDRAKPVYFMQEKEVAGECKTGNCDKVKNTSEAEKIIQEYLK